MRCTSRPTTKARSAERIKTMIATTRLGSILTALRAPPVQLFNDGSGGLL